MSLRFTEEQFAALQSRRSDPFQEVIKAAGFTGGKVPEKLAGKQRGETLRLVLPFKLPTWNQLLAMGHWQRAKVRNWIKARVSECIQNGEDLQTPMGSARSISLTPSCLQEYYAMITPVSSKKSRLPKNKPRKMKRLSI